MINVGGAVDDFQAVDQQGRTRRLSEFLAEGPVVLYFYPKAFTPGCTREACHFRDMGAELRAVGAQAVGISADAVDRQARFDETHNLGFPLLSDPDRRLARMFGVKRPGPIFNRRATFVIDTDRRVLATVASELNMNVHADRALEVLRSRPRTQQGAADETSLIGLPVRAPSAAATESRESEEPAGR